MRDRAVICLLVENRPVSGLPSQMTDAYTWCRDRHVTNDAGPTQYQPSQVKAVDVSCRECHASNFAGLTQFEPT